MGSSLGIKVEAIENYLTILEKFGKWPSFHDSEIYSIFLDRQGSDGPSIEIRIHAFTVKAEADAQGSHRDKQAMITMLFNGIESEEIVGFNEQNAIFELDMQPDQDSIKVTISSSYGCAGSFTCKHVAIKSVEDFTG